MLQLVCMWSQQDTGNVTNLKYVAPCSNLFITNLKPFCDGTHKSPFLNIKLRPVRFVPAETKEYW